MKRIVVAVALAIVAGLAQAGVTLVVQFQGGPIQEIAGDTAAIEVDGQHGWFDIFGAYDVSSQPGDRVMANGFEVPVFASGLWTWRVHRIVGGMELVDGWCVAHVTQNVHLAIRLECVPAGSVPFSP